MYEYAIEVLEDILHKVELDIGSCSKGFSSLTERETLYKGKHQLQSAIEVLKREEEK